MQLTAQSLRQRPPHLVEAALAELSDEQSLALLYDWEFWARASQLIPPASACELGDWVYWLLLAGRGNGKTRTGGETVRTWIREGFNYVNLIGATADDARDIMIEGESGILAICPPDERPRYVKGERKLIWPNGAVSLIFTADEPERLRGKQHQKLWADELAAWRYPEAWDQAMFGLRLGLRPQAIATTTPRPTKLVRELMADPACVVTRGTTYENKENLAQAFINVVVKAYEGTRLGRQELDGEVLDDNPNALFKRVQLDRDRLTKAQFEKLGIEVVRTVVAIDPAVTSEEDSDETAIVVACSGYLPGKDDRLHGFLFDEDSGIYTPKEWAANAVRLYYDHEADRIVGEVNNGGEMVENTIRTVDGGEDVSYKDVHASKGKRARAEPISALSEQGRLHHVGAFAKLEDQLCEYDPLTYERSPDRLDAYVWAFTELFGGGSGSIIDVWTQQARNVRKGKVAEAKEPKHPDGKDRPGLHFDKHPRRR